MIRKSGRGQRVKLACENICKRQQQWGRENEHFFPWGCCFLWPLQQISPSITNVTLTVLLQVQRPTGFLQDSHKAGEESREGTQLCPYLVSKGEKNAITADWNDRVKPFSWWERAQRGSREECSCRCDAECPQLSLPGTSSEMGGHKELYVG